MRARSSIEVRDRDVEVALGASEGLTLQFQVRVEGSPANIDLTRLRVSVRPDPFVTGLPSPGAAPSATGSGSINAILPGEYRVYVSPLLYPSGSPTPALPENLQNLYIKSVQAGDVEILNNGLKLDSALEAPIQVVLGANPGRIAGRASGAETARVVLAPDAGRGFRTDAYKSTFTDADGRFQFQNVPPGAYHVFAWSDVANDVWLDPDFIRLHETEGKAIVITEGNNNEIQLAVAP